MVTIIGSEEELQRAVKKLPVARQTALSKKVQNMLNRFQTQSKALGSKMENHLEVTMTYPIDSAPKRKGESSLNDQPPKSLKKLS